MAWARTGKRQWMLTEVEDDVTEERQISALLELSEEEVVTEQHRCMREIVLGSPNVRPDDDYNCLFASGVHLIRCNCSFNSSAL